MWYVPRESHIHTTPCKRSVVSELPGFGGPPACACAALHCTAHEVLQQRRGSCVHALMCTSIRADRRFREARAAQGQTRSHLRRSKYRSTAISISRTIISSVPVPLNIRRPLDIDVHGRKPPRPAPAAREKGQEHEAAEAAGKQREIDPSYDGWITELSTSRLTKEQHVRACPSILMICRLSSLVQEIKKY